MKFCPLCSNLLVKSTEKNELIFICNTCGFSENSTPSDSLMLNVSLKEEKSLQTSEIYLNVAAKDHIAPLIEKKCINCDSEVVRDINVIDTGESIYICPKCEHRFM
jgi:DNA-directed RNA polymerase subunit M/transcription elongation factor TFIIS